MNQFKFKILTVKMTVISICKPVLPHPRRLFMLQLNDVAAVKDDVISAGHAALDHDSVTTRHLNNNRNVKKKKKNFFKLLIWLNMSSQGARARRPPLSRTGSTGRWPPSPPDLHRWLQSEQERANL